ncbi:hypothetical protein Tco_1443427, partial [Tanacetum coccineum]
AINRIRYGRYGVLEFPWSKDHVSHLPECADMLYLLNGYDVLNVRSVGDFHGINDAIKVTLFDVINRAQSLTLAKPGIRRKVHTPSREMRLYIEPSPYIERMLLAQKEEAKGKLDYEEQDFMVGHLEAFDSNCEEELTTTLVLMADRVDSFDSDCDEDLTASAIFMEKISPAGSVTDNDVGPSYDTYALS